MSPPLSSQPMSPPGQLRGAIASAALQHYKIILRDKRVMLLAIALLVTCITVLISATARNARLREERAAAVALDTKAWQMQGDVDPHGAAHFGHYFFKPIPPLSAFDPGMFEHLGTMVRLEAHKQNPAGDRPGDAGTSLTRLAGFSAAEALQLLAPLLIIITSFGAFSGARARTLLSQELSTGTSALVLMIGRLAASSTVVAAIVVAFALSGAVVLTMGGAQHTDFLRFGLMLAGYGLYLLTFLCLTLGVSALCRAERVALTTMLAVWIATALIVPRVAPAFVAQRLAVPSLPEFQTQVEASIDAALDAAGPREKRAERITSMILEQYGVSRVEDLPVNRGGALLMYAEHLSTLTYRKYFEGLYRTYSQRASLERVFSTLSPLVALKPWSAALASTDFPAHRAFLDEAETYRYGFVQKLNQHILENRPNTPDRYVANVARLTADLDGVQPSDAPLAATWGRQWPDFLALVLWSAASLCFALWSARRLGRHAL